MATYKLYDEHEEQYVEDVETFEGIQEFLANEWENDLYPATDMYEEMHDKIMTMKLIEQLEEVASGLGYSIEEVNE